MFQEQALINEMTNLRKFARRLTKNTHGADDLLQATLLRAIEKKQMFENGTNLFSWSSKIMFNLFISGYRQKKRYDTQYDPDHYISQISVEPSQEAYVDLITVREGINRLSPQHREILLFASIQGMSYEEIAEKLGIPGGTVRSRLARARRSLQTLLRSGPLVAANARSAVLKEGFPPIHPMSKELGRVDLR